ncbi:MAG TPA: DUF3108 domain-containing protein [Tahibacter sp.]|uniref:DUF3108 domain-containing protein n=1 Tax=Tahibacter sp. TaxID=2056211 RepID=UPI002CFA4681|nr:DUF3108 domain-containing protein [Tahibacter sp.]HSX60464.1 DUF3108 domain-containing protein [Tahibacter sp.]
MRVRALLAFCVLPALALAEPAPERSDATQMLPLKPFVATYDVKRGGKMIGEATMTLSQTDASHWTLVTETRGTAGMAKLLGLDVREESRFAVLEGSGLQSVDYRYRQDATLKSKQRRIEFDWPANEARVTDKDELFRYALQPQTIDRHVVVLALGRAQRSTAPEFAVASKEAIERQRFERRESKTITLPAGQFAATRLERTDKPGKGSSWYAPQLLAPLQVEQVQKDGNNIVMELKAVR